MSRFAISEGKTMLTPEEWAQEETRLKRTLGRHPRPAPEIEAIVKRHKRAGDRHPQDHVGGAAPHRGEPSTRRSSWSSTKNTWGSLSGSTSSTGGSSPSWSGWPLRPTLAASTFSETESKVPGRSTSASHRWWSPGPATTWSTTGARPSPACFTTISPGRAATRRRRPGRGRHPAQAAVQDRQGAAGVRL